jgi:hypothetical protein
MTALAGRTPAERTAVRCKRLLYADHSFQYDSHSITAISLHITMVGEAAGEHASSETGLQPFAVQRRSHR